MRQGIPAYGAWTREDLKYCLKTKGTGKFRWSRIETIIREVRTHFPESPIWNSMRRWDGLMYSMSYHPIEMGPFADYIKQVAVGIFSRFGQAYIDDDAHKNKDCIDFVTLLGQVTGLWQIEQRWTMVPNSFGVDVWFVSERVIRGRKAAVAVHVCLRQRMGMNKDVVGIIMKRVYKDCVDS